MASAGGRVKTRNQELRNKIDSATNACYFHYTRLSANIVRRDILSGTVPGRANRLRDGGHDRRGRFRPRRLGVSKARQKPVVCDEKTEKTIHRRCAAARARVQRENNPGVMRQPVYRQVSIVPRQCVGASFVCI